MPNPSRRPVPSSDNDAPVPVTVWPAGPDETDLPARLLATFTRPGQLVVALNPDPALVAAAAAGGQRMTALVSRRRQADQLAALAERTAAAPRRARLRVHHLPNRQMAAALRLSPAQAALLIAPTDTSADLVALAAAGVAPAGCLVLSTTPGPRLALTAPSPEQAAALRSAGLVYLQHIVAVHAAIHDSTWAPDTVPQQPDGAAHHRIHRDWYAFRRPAGRGRP